MQIDFTKMHGLGNDFVVVDAIRQRFSPEPKLIRRLSDRHFGIGFDQLLLVEAASNPNVDFRYRIFNCDGSEVEQCGNGARCFARFVSDKNLSTKEVIRVETSNGLLDLRLLDNDQVQVNMGIPELDPLKIPFRAERQATQYSLEIGLQKISIGAISMGNPHAVVLVEDCDTAPVDSLGAELESHPDFPHRVNAGFAQIIDRSSMRVRVFERGVGETRACGSGACAAMVHARLLNLVDEEVSVDLNGGRLVISWAGGEAPVLMTGSAATVFEGQIEI